MPKRFTGKDVKITFDAGIASFQSIDIHIMGSKWTANASDTKTLQQGSGVLSCEINLKGWEDSTTGGLEFVDLATLVLSGAAPSAFTWTDTAGTPVSRLPTNFFTLFPLSSMRVDDISGGSGGPDKPSEWTAKVSCGNLDAGFGA